MEQGSFTKLPQEIGIDIFSRLPFPTIINCKRVCKAWHHLLSTREFVDCHFMKSLPGLVLSKEAGKETSRRYRVVEFIDPPDSGLCPFKTVYDFSLPHRAILLGSANGYLLFLKDENDYDQNLFVCNPLTREYINLPSPIESHPFRYHNYGFGVSKVSGEYKVLRISFCRPPSYNFYLSYYKFEVYTLGTGSWRNVAVPAGSALARRDDPVVFVDGKLYSIVKESCISCFDLETEVLSTVSCPCSRIYETHVCALEGRLCLCLNGIDGLVIWVMDEVGHWRKEFVICDAKMHGYWRESFMAVKLFGDGEMLLMEGAGELYYYSRKRQTLTPFSVTRNGRNSYRVGYSYAPSFLPLKTFANRH